MMATLFYRCYYAYLKGDLEESRLFFNFLTKEYKSCKDKKVFSKRKLMLLKDVRTALQTKKVGQDNWVKDDLNASKMAENKVSKRPQNELVRLIHDDLENLRTILNAPNNFHLYNIEHPCDPFGRVDMLYKDDSVVYPVEVKTGTGNHDLVGQIAKYDRSLRFQLHLNLWENVLPVTICKNYSDFAIKELKKRGVTTLQYFEKNKKVTLRPI